MKFRGIRHCERFFAKNRVAIHTLKGCGFYYFQKMRKFKWRFFKMANTIAFWSVDFHYFAHCTRNDKKISRHFKFFHNFSLNFAQNLANFLNFRAHNQKQSRIFNLFLLEFPRPFSDLCNAARSRASGWERSRAALWWRVPQSSGRGFCEFVNLQILKFSRVFKLRNLS